jgi:ketosteroid isomerase-like protein
MITVTPFFAAAAQGKAENPDTQKAIESVLTKQAEAWNRGDLDEFMKGYLHSENTSYTSGGTEVWGYEALHDRYQKKYGKSPETMGKLKFSELKVFPLGAKNALVIGHWHLDPQKPPAADGTFSLVFVKTKEGWKVLHDHTSLKKEAS